jgi:hypothetical protein
MAFAFVYALATRKHSREITGTHLINGSEPLKNRDLLDRNPMCEIGSSSMIQCSGRRRRLHKNFHKRARASLWHTEMLENHRMLEIEAPHASFAS